MRVARAYLDRRECGETFRDQPGNRRGTVCSAGSIVYPVLAGHGRYDRPPQECGFAPAYLDHSVNDVLATTVLYHFAGIDGG